MEWNNHNSWDWWGGGVTNLKQLPIGWRLGPGLDRYAIIKLESKGLR
jgi:hypothetical protein